MVANLRVELGALGFKPDNANALLTVLLFLINKGSRDLEKSAAIAEVSGYARLRYGGC